MLMELLIVASAVLSFAAIRMKNLFYAVITLAVVDVLIAGVFYMMAAPDIAITQAAIASGLSTFVFMLALGKTEKVEEQ